mgnify:CR=1 FL=1
MKKLKELKGIYSKIIISCIVAIILIETVLAKPVSAKQYSFGGTLLQPVIQFGAFMADGVIELLQNSLLGTEGAFEEFDITKDSGLKRFFMVVGALVVGIIGGIIAVYSPVGKAIAAKMSAAGFGTAATILGIGIVRNNRNWGCNSFCKKWNA